MARPAVIPIQVKSNAGTELRRTAADFRALEREVKQNARAFEQAQRAGERLAEQAVKKVNREFQQLQRESRATTQAQIQAAAAAKNYGAALELVERELQKTGNSQRRVYQLQAQQARLFRQAQQEVAGGARESSGAIGLLTGAVGQLGIAFGAGAIAQGTFQLAQQGAQVIRTQQAFDELAQKAGTSGEVLLTALRTASGGEITDLNLQLAANKANLLGVADSAGEFSVLMEIARDRAAKLGLTTSQAFDDLVTGLGRGSALILDNLGIIVEAGEVNEQYAKSIGKTSMQLTEAEKKQALINEVIRQGQSTLRGSTDSATETSQAYAALSTAAANLKDRLAVLAAEAFQPAAEAGTKLLTGFDGTQESFFRLAEGTDFFSKSLFGLQSQSMQLSETEKQMVGTLLSWIGIESEATLKVQEHTAALTGDADAGIGLSSALQQATIKLREQQAALQEDAAQALISDANSQLLAQTKSQLAGQAQVAANALVASGNAGAAAAVRLATSSSQVDQLTAAYYRLAQAQAVSAAKDSRIAGEIAARNGGKVPERAVVTAARVERDLEAARKRAAAATRRASPNGGLSRSDRADLALGDDSADLQLLRRKLATLKKGSVEYRETLAKIQATEARLRKGGARAGAAEKLERARDDLRTDEEKLAARRSELGTTKNEERRLTLIREIQDLEKKITDEREKQTQAAIDAQLAAIDDRKKRREEEREVSRARRVLDSAATSEEQKAAARDVLEHIPLEQRRRALEIAEKTRDAGGRAVPGSTGAPAIPANTPIPGANTARPSAQFLPVTLPQISTANALQANTLNLNLDLEVIIDGQQVAAVIQPKIRSSNIQNMRLGIDRVAAGGG